MTSSASSLDTKHAPSLEQPDVCIFLLDADGAVYNNDYKKKAQTAAENAKSFFIELETRKKIVSESNPALFKEMKSLAGSQKKVVLACGSNRQSQAIDVENAYSHGYHKGPFTGEKGDLKQAILPALTNILPQHSVSYDDFLLQEIFDDKTCPLDKDKFYLLYAQVQRAALQNPGKKIHIHFFDDGLDILDRLSAFLAKHLEFIPNNITLHLRAYNGTLDQRYQSNNSGKTTLKIYPPIQGTGSPNNDYKNTIKTFHSQILRSGDPKKRTINSLTSINENVEGFRQLHIAGTKTSAINSARDEKRDGLTQPLLAEFKLTSQDPVDTVAVYREQVVAYLNNVIENQYSDDDKKRQVFIDSEKHRSLVNIRTRLNNYTTEKSLRNLITYIRSIVSEHRNESCWSCFFKPKSLDSLNQIFDEKNNLKIKPKK